MGETDSKQITSELLNWYCEKYMGQIREVWLGSDGVKEVRKPSGAHDTLAGRNEWLSLCREGGGGAVEAQGTASAKVLRQKGAQCFL